MRTYIKATITPKGERAVRGGHPWVFSDEILSVEAVPADGSLVDVCSQKGKYLGTGFYTFPGRYEGYSQDINPHVRHRGRGQPTVGDCFPLE